MSARSVRRYTPHHLLAERYGPSKWWVTPKPAPPVDLDGTERCVGCGAQVPSDQPCRRCSRKGRR